MKTGHAERENQDRERDRNRRVSTQISPFLAMTSPTMTNIQPKPLFPSAPFIYAFLAETSAPCVQDDVRYPVQP